MLFLRSSVVALSVLAFLNMGEMPNLPGETCSYEQQTTVHVQDFAGAGRNGGLYSFDISPDGTKIAAKYGLDEDGSFSVWTGVLDLRTRTVVKKIELIKSVKKAEPSNPLFRGDPQFRGAVRYTGDNQRIVVEVGNSIDIFRASDLAREGTISIDPATELQGDLRGFAISGDGNRLALQIGDPTTVRLYGVSTRALLGEWKVAWNSRLALSPDGAYAAIPAPVAAERGILPIEIADAVNGSPKGEVKSGFGYHDEWGSDAPVPLFLSNLLLLLSPDGGTDATGHHSGDSLRLFDWRTGKLLAQFPIPNSGTIGVAGASADGKQVLTFSMPQSPFAVRADNAWWGHLARVRSPEILFFETGDTTPMCRISPVAFPGPNLSSEAVGDFALRYDATLRHVGLFQEGGITIWLRTAGGPSLDDRFQPR